MDRLITPAVKIISLAASGALALAGCGGGAQGDPDSERRVKQFDRTDPKAVAEAWGKAIATGDCEAASPLHIPDSYGIDCNDPDQFNEFVEYRPSPVSHLVRSRERYNAPWTSRGVD